MIELRDVCFSAESAGVKKDILQNIIHAGTYHCRHCKAHIRSDPF